MNPFTKIWFWLLLLSIVGFIMFFIFIEAQGQTAVNKSSTPMWIWILFMISIAFFLVAFVLYAIYLANYHKGLEIAEACGELPPPIEKKKMECPKPKCVEKRILECTDRKSVNKVETITVDKKETVVPISNEAFSAGRISSLNTLSPVSSPMN